MVFLLALSISLKKTFRWKVLNDFSTIIETGFLVLDIKEMMPMGRKKTSTSFCVSYKQTNHIWSHVKQHGQKSLTLLLYQGHHLKKTILVETILETAFLMRAKKYFQELLTGMRKVTLNPLHNSLSSFTGPRKPQANTGVICMDIS